jgi:hypothetical protein
VPRAQEIVRADGLIVRRTPREGDMRWDGKVWRRWNGRRWVTAAYSMRPDRLRVPRRMDLDPPISSKQARKVLTMAVEDQIATNGASVVFEGEQGVILGYRKPVSHVAHGIATLITFGFWAPVWIAASAASRERRIRLSVDAWGNVWVKPVASP